MTLIIYYPHDNNLLEKITLLVVAFVTLDTKSLVYLQIWKVGMSCSTIQTNSTICDEV